MLLTRRDLGFLVSKIYCPETVSSRKDVYFALRELCLVSFSIVIFSASTKWKSLFSFILMLRCKFVLHNTILITLNSLMEILD